MIRFSIAFSLTFLVFSVALADEGMWTFNHFPSKTVQQKYGFEPNQSWLDHVRLSSARLAGGCSGSFVSKNGLVMTNHHCAHSCIEQLSKEGKDYVASGFYAKNEGDEVRCPEIEINRLVEISDVTKELRAATKGLTGKAFNDKNKAEQSRLEQECAKGSEDVRCDVVTLYHGGQYQLYKYQRYQDVRLVFAPELAIAFFGGDPDNFMFPRYDLDVSFLRVYDHGKPLQSNDYFRWSQTAAKEGDLTFVTGHPGGTSRLLTIAELDYVRDVTLFNNLTYYSELRGMLNEYGRRGPEQRRTSEHILFGVENSLKVFKGRFAALTDQKFFSKKVAAEKEFRARVNANGKWRKEYGKAWDEIAKAEDEMRKMYPHLRYIEGTTFGSKLFEYAKDVVRGSVELPKPNETRLREFTESKLPQLKQALFSTAPIYDELEIQMLTFGLTKMREGLTADDPFVKKTLGQRSPAELAEALVKGTTLKDIKVRQALFDGGAKAIAESKDPLVVFMRDFEPEARQWRTKYENEVETVLKQNDEKVAQAQFAIYGSNTYPDATFTLRLSYGSIKGYEENGHTVNPITTFQGAYDRNTGREPFALPKTWLDAKPKVDLATPLDIATTNDIIGGNSGSPVVNKNAEVIGLIFDGNIQSLGGDYGFDASVNRAVAVHSSALMQALEKIYAADRVVKDIRESAAQPVK